VDALDTVTLQHAPSAKALRIMKSSLSEPLDTA